MTIGEQRYDQKKLLLTPMIYRKASKHHLKLLEKEGLRYQCNEYGRKYEEKELIASLQDCEALICEEEIISRKVMASCPHLEIISILGHDKSNVDLAAAEELGIALSTSQKADVQALADLSFAMLLSLARKFPLQKSKSNLGKDVWGQSLGLIGFGPLAQAMAERAWGFNMEVLYHDPYYERSYPFSEEVSLKSLFKRSDFISLNTELNPETYQILDQKAFSCMKKKPIILNISHPDTIHFPALYHALKTEVIGSVAVHEKTLKGLLGEEMGAMEEVMTYADKDIATESSLEKHSLKAIQNVLEKLERE